MKAVQLKFVEGRFGNQLFQYAFARALAEKYGAELQTSDWIGPQIFIGVEASPINGDDAISVEG